MGNSITGLGGGALVALLALGILFGYRCSGVVNFAQGALATFSAYTFSALAKTGRLFSPFPGPGLYSVASSTGAPRYVAATVALIAGALVGLLVYFAGFRLVRDAPPLAKIVVSIGYMLLLQSVISYRFGTAVQSTPSMFPGSGVLVSVGSILVPLDRFILAGLALVVAFALWALFRYSSFGVSARACAENEKAAVLVGLSPDRQATIGWLIAGALAGIAGVAGSEVTNLDPTRFTLLVIPALGAVLVAKFKSFGVAAVVGLIIGMVQNLIGYLAVRFTWLPSSGLQDSVGLILIICMMFLGGSRLPERSAFKAPRLPRVPPVTLHPVAGAVGVVVVGASFLIFSGGIRLALINSLVGALVCLSLVVLTGYLGQVSLFQLAIAGGTAYLLAGFTTGLGIPFPIAPLIAAVLAAGIGVIVAIPALRIRGVNLAMVTLAVGYAVQRLVFDNTEVNSGGKGAAVKSPRLFGLDLSFVRGREIGRPVFGFAVLIVVALVACGVASLRGSALGRQMLAVRGSERAAAAAGINVARTKLMATAVSGFIAGLGGVFIAYQYSTVPGPLFGALASVSVLAIAYLGGVTTISGGLLGGFLFAGGVSYYLINKYVFGDSASGQQLYAILAGASLVLTAIFNPEGIAGPTGTAVESMRVRVRNLGNRVRGESSARREDLPAIEDGA